MTKHVKILLYDKTCHVSNLLDLILKFGPEILSFVFFPMELLALDLDFFSFRYVLLCTKHPNSIKIEREVTPCLENEKKNE
jgi:hypothetical protein